MIYLCSKKHPSVQLLLSLCPLENLCTSGTSLVWQHRETFSKIALCVKADLRLGEKPCMSRQESRDVATSLVSFVCQSKRQDKGCCYKSCELCVSKQKPR
jgi:hypothetical protein